MWSDIVLYEIGPFRERSAVGLTCLGHTAPDMQQSKLFSQHYAIAVAFCMLKRLRSQDLRQGGRAHHVYVDLCSS